MAASSGDAGLPNFGSDRARLETVVATTRVQQNVVDQLSMFPPPMLDADRCNDKTSRKVDQGSQSHDHAEHLMQWDRLHRFHHDRCMAHLVQGVLGGRSVHQGQAAVFM